MENDSSTEIFLEFALDCLGLSSVVRLAARSCRDYLWNGIDVLQLADLVVRKAPQVRIQLAVLRVEGGVTGPQHAHACVDVLVELRCQFLLLQVFQVVPVSFHLRNTSTYCILINASAELPWSVLRSWTVFIFVLSALMNTLVVATGSIVGKLR